MMEEGIVMNLDDTYNIIILFLSILFTNLFDKYNNLEDIQLFSKRF